MARLFSRSCLLPRLVYYTSLPSSTCHHLRCFSAARGEYSKERLRHVWISGLMDPDKMGPVERKLLYKGQIELMHRVRNFMERVLKNEAEAEAENITLGNRKELYLNERFQHNVIRAAITSFNWKKDYKIKVIDTPGRVDDFTDEVETALRTFDSGAIHVLCSLDGVQSHSITVDQQMIKYKLPRLIFINNLDHKGANPWEVLNQARSKLYHRCAAIQVPIGLEDDFKGLVDLVQLKAYYFHGSNRQKVVIKELPPDMVALVSDKRRELAETVAQVDDKLAQAFSKDMPISAADLEEAVRRATITRRFTPIFMGSAFEYKGLQLLLDGVLNYLPCSNEACNHALHQSKNGEKHTILALAYTLKRNYGQITYLRIYEGVIRKGDFITNVDTGKMFEVPRLYRWRNDELEVIPEAHAGEIVTVYDRLIGDVDYAPGETFTEGFVRYTMTSVNDSGVQVSKASKHFKEIDVNQANILAVS